MTGAYNLFTLYYNAMVTNQHMYINKGGVALPPCQLRGPLPLSPMCVPQWLFLVATLALVGSNAQESGHSLWCWSPIMGHQK